MRWPGRKGQPRPQIPSSAQEKITHFDERGAKGTSEFWLDGRLVGRASWESDGTPSIAGGIRDGVRVGYHIEYRDGTVSYAEPFKNGLVHGWAKQFDSRGRLIFMSPFNCGAGTDYWCNDQGRLPKSTNSSTASPPASSAGGTRTRRRSTARQAGWLARGTASSATGPRGGSTVATDSSSLAGTGSRSENTWQPRGTIQRSRPIGPRTIHRSGGSPTDSSS